RNLGFGAARKYLHAELSAPAGGMDDNPPRHRRASVRVVGPIIAAVPIGRITVAVAIGRVAVAIGWVAVAVGRVAVTVAVGWVAVTIAIVGPPQRRANERADGKGADAPPPSPAGLRRFGRAHGNCAGEQHGD